MDIKNKPYLSLIDFITFLAPSCSINAIKLVGVPGFEPGPLAPKASALPSYATLR